MTEFIKKSQGTIVLICKELEYIGTFNDINQLDELIDTYNNFYKNVISLDITIEMIPKGTKFIIIDNELLIEPEINWIIA